jgi:hypothetical protein
MPHFYWRKEQVMEKGIDQTSVMIKLWINEQNRRWYAAWPPGCGSWSPMKCTEERRRAAWSPRCRSVFGELFRKDAGRLLGRRVADRGRRRNVQRRDVGLLGRRDADRSSESCTGKTLVGCLAAGGKDRLDWERERVPTHADLGTGVVLAGLPCLLTLVAGVVLPCLPSLPPASGLAFPPPWPFACSPALFGQ